MLLFSELETWFVVWFVIGGCPDAPSLRQCRTPLRFLPCTAQLLLLLFSHSLMTKLWSVATREVPVVLESDEKTKQKKC